MSGGVLLAAGVGLAGGLGAMLRLTVDTLVRRRITRFPAGTVLINVTGSLLLGLVVGLASGGLLAPSWRLVLGTGFLGGYTTFSTATQESVVLWREGRRAAAALNTCGTLLVGTGAAALGLLLGAAFAH